MTTILITTRTAALMAHDEPMTNLPLTLTLLFSISWSHCPLASVQGFTPETLNLCWPDSALHFFSCFDLYPHRLLLCCYVHFITFNLIASVQTLWLKALFLNFLSFIWWFEIVWKRGRTCNQQACCQTGLFDSILFIPFYQALHDNKSVIRSFCSFRAFVKYNLLTASHWRKNAFAHLERPVDTIPWAIHSEAVKRRLYCGKWDFAVGEIATCICKLVIHSLRHTVQITSCFTPLFEVSSEKRVLTIQEAVTSGPWWHFNQSCLITLKSTDVPFYFLVSSITCATFQLPKKWPSCWMKSHQIFLNSLCQQINRFVFCFGGFSVCPELLIVCVRICQEILPVCICVSEALRRVPTFRSLPKPLFVTISLLPAAVSKCFCLCRVAE